MPREPDDTGQRHDGPADDGAPLPVGASAGGRGDLPSDPEAERARRALAVAASVRDNLPAPGPRGRYNRHSRAELNARVQEIAELMLTGAWRRGRTVHEIAKRHGVPVSTARTWASQASRLVAPRDLEGMEELRASTVGKLEQIAAEAHEVGEYRAATSALRTLAEVAGIIHSAPTVAISVTLAGAPTQANPVELAQTVEWTWAFFTERHPELAAEFKAFLVERANGGSVIDVPVEHLDGSDVEHGREDDGRADDTSDGGAGGADDGAA